MKSEISTNWKRKCHFSAIRNLSRGSLDACQLYYLLQSQLFLVVSESHYQGQWTLKLLGKIIWAINFAGSFLKWSLNLVLMMIFQGRGNSEVKFSG